MNEFAFSVITSVGWTLVHFAWQGLLVGVATAIALVCLRNARPEHRYSVACGGLLLCLAWPVYDLVQRLRAPAAEYFDPSFGDMLAGADAQSRLVLTVQDNLLPLVGLWALCAALLALRVVLGLAWVARAARGQPAPPEWQERVARMAAEWNITRRVRLRLDDCLSSPVTAGWLRPVVILPTSLVTGMPPELLEALLAHEMAHIRRFDYLVNLAQNAVETLLFYHPAVWWISGRIRIEREQIADDLAANYLGEPRRLAVALSELEKMQFSAPRLVVAATGGELTARIRRLLRPTPQARTWSAALPVLGLALACAALLAHAQPSGSQGIVQKAHARFDSCTKPMYPSESIRNGHTGTVTLKFLVSGQGRVLEGLVHDSSGHSALDAAALNAISLCDFVPAQREGKAIESWMRMQYVWTLK